MYKIPDGNEEIYNKYITHLTEDDILNGIELDDEVTRRDFSLELFMGGRSIDPDELGGLQFEMDMGVDDWPIGLITYKRMDFTVANDAANIEDGLSTGMTVKPVIGLAVPSSSGAPTILKVPYGTYVVDSVAKDMTLKNYSCYDWLYYISDIDCDFGGETYPTTVGHILSTITGKYADKGMVPLTDDNKGDWAEWWDDVIGQPKKYKDYEPPEEEEEDDELIIDDIPPLEDTYPEDSGQEPPLNPGACCDCDHHGGEEEEDGDEPEDEEPEEEEPEDDVYIGEGIIIECSDEGYDFTLGRDAWIRCNILGIEEWEEDLYLAQWCGNGLDCFYYDEFAPNIHVPTGGRAPATKSGVEFFFTPDLVTDGRVELNVRVWKREEVDQPYKTDSTRSGTVTIKVKPNNSVKSYDDMVGWDFLENGGGVYSDKSLLGTYTFKVIRHVEKSTSGGLTHLYMDYGYELLKEDESFCDYNIGFGDLPIVTGCSDSQTKFETSYVGFKLKNIASGYKQTLDGVGIIGKMYQNDFYWAAMNKEKHQRRYPLRQEKQADGSPMGTYSLPINPNDVIYRKVSDGTTGELQNVKEDLINGQYTEYYYLPISEGKSFYYPNFYYASGESRYLHFPLAPDAAPPNWEICITNHEVPLDSEKEYDNQFNMGGIYREGADEIKNNYYHIADLEISFYGTRIKQPDFSDLQPEQSDQFDPVSQNSVSLMKLSRKVSSPSYDDNGNLIVTYEDTNESGDPTQTPNENGQVLVDTPEEIGFEMKEGQMLGYIAAYCGGNVAMDHEGKVRLLRLTNSGGSASCDKSIPNDQVAIPEIDNCEASSTLGGLIVHTSTYEGDDIKLGNSKPSQTHYVLEIDNPFMTEERASEIFSEMSSLTYYPMRVVFLSDPRLWLGDLLHFDGFSQYNEASGVTVEVIRDGYYPIMKLTSYYDGAPSLQIEANCSNLSDRTNSFTGTLNDKIDEVSAKVEETDEKVRDMKYQLEEIRALVGYINELFAIEVSADNIVSATISTKNIKIAPTRRGSEGGIYIDGDSIDFLDDDGIQRLHIGSSGDPQDYYIRFLNANGYTRELRALDPPGCEAGHTKPTTPPESEGESETSSSLSGIELSSEDTINLTDGEVQTIKVRLTDQISEYQKVYCFVRFKTNVFFVDENGNCKTEITLQFTPQDYNKWQTVKVVGFDDPKYTDPEDNILRFNTINSSKVVANYPYVDVNTKYTDSEDTWGESNKDFPPKVH